MQIQTMSGSKQNLDFKMAVKASPEAKDFMKKNFSKKQLTKLSEIIEEQKYNENDIFLSVESERVQCGMKYNGGALEKSFANKEYLAASVKYFKFKAKGWFKSPISVIKKAQNYANEFKYKQLPDLDNL